MLVKPSGQPITEKDLLDLIETKSPESKNLEYKRQLPDNSESGKIKFLKGVTAFANTVGGDLIYGIEASEGIPVRILPLQLDSMDQTQQRLESLLSNSVEPRLAGIEMLPVPLSSGGFALVVRVKQSWASPHRVSYGGHAHFYARNSAGVYPMDVFELRQSFNAGEVVSRRVREFRAARLAMIEAGEAPAFLLDGIRFVLHLIPLSAVVGLNDISISTDRDGFRQFFPPDAKFWNFRFNLDGRLTYAESHSGASRAYTQLFRTGAIEALFITEPRDDDRKIFYPWYEESIVDAARGYIRGLHEIGESGPMYAAIALIDAKGYQLNSDGNMRLFAEHPIDKSVLVLPEVFVEDDNQDPAIFLKPIFDMVWNASGFQRSFNYDADGNWKK